MVDKNKAVLDFLATCPEIATSPFFVNFMNAKDNDVQFMTNSNDTYLNRKFIDGSEMKQYLFSIVITKTMSDMAIAKDIDANENIDDIAEIQKVMDWVNTQGENQNFPDFGEDCIIEEMHTTAENPDIDGINIETIPALALYSMEIKINYIDYSKIIYK